MKEFWMNVLIGVTTVVIGYALLKGYERYVENKRESRSSQGGMQSAEGPIVE